MSYNYYELLNVPPNASKEQIDVAYRAVQKVFSKENKAIKEVFSEQESEMFLQMMTEAYQVLKNEELRAIYDHKSAALGFRNSELASEALVIANELQKQTEAEKLKPKFVRDEAFEIEVSSCNDWTGSMLKRMRLYKQLTPDLMYEKIKVNPWYITAIEEMDPSNLPATVFIRGYVVQIAKFFGLNEKTVADSYMKNFVSLNGRS